MEEIGKAHLLDPEEKKDTRELWEEIFAEDSGSFLDYYDKWKGSENECYGIYSGEGKLVSMIQMNPYEMRVKEKRAESRYVIAVATKAGYRHRGLMRSLLKTSLQDMKKKKIPFVFLMPAAEEIYRPFDFRFFYRMNTGEIGGGEKKEETDGLSVRLARREEIPALSRFSEKVLGEISDCYAARTPYYLEGLFEELVSEAGGILLILKSGTGEIMALVPFWGREKVEIREILCRPEAGEEVRTALEGWFSRKVSVDGAAFPVDGRKPVIMGRVVHVGAFLELFASTEPLRFLIRVTDSFLEEEAVYLWEMTEAGSRAERISGDRAGWPHIKAAAAGLFGWLSGGEALGELIQRGEIETGDQRLLEKVKIWESPYLNEIV